MLTFWNKNQKNLFRSPVLASCLSVQFLNIVALSSLSLSLITSSFRLTYRSLKHPQQHLFATKYNNYRCKAREEIIFRALVLHL